MTSSGSSEMMRSQTSESNGSPGTIGVMPCLFSVRAPSGVSRRRLASRVFPSKPWQTKQRSERSGRIWSLKSMRSSAPNKTVRRAKKREANF